MTRQPRLEDYREAVAQLREKVEAAAESVLARVGLQRELSWLRIGSQMQEAQGVSPRLGGLEVSQLQASAGISALQSKACSLQITTRGSPIRTKEVVRPAQEKRPRKVRGNEPQVTGFQTGLGRAGLSRSVANPLHVATRCFTCAGVTTCCHMLPHVVVLCHVLPTLSYES